MERTNARHLARLLAISVFVIGAAASADTPNYSSESACLRAESPEVCAKLFPREPPPRPPPAAPQSLKTCTEILDQATIVVIKTTSAEQFGQFAEAEAGMKQYTTLAKEAIECSNDVKSASKFDQQLWADSKERFWAKHKALEALIRSRGAD